jgi:endoglucanase
MLFPTTLVGSYPQPEWLIDRKKLAGRFPPRVRAKELWRIPDQYLEEAWNDATLLAIRAQERAGIDIISDGEMRRESYSNRFATALDGVDLDNPGEAWKEVVAHKTDTPAPEAWGAWFDAGDWEPRRIIHLRSALALIELAELHPRFVAGIDHPGTTLPQTAKLPGLLAECAWGVDLWLRLQRADGGVGYGIENGEDPHDGEVSWHQREDSYVFEPDCDASWQFCTVAGRLAMAVRTYDAAYAERLQTAALNAFAYAERDRAARLEQKKDIPWEANDARNLAALTAYALTGDRRYDAVFRDGTVLTDASPEVFNWGAHVQEDAAFYYTQLPERLRDPALTEVARRLTIGQAERALAYQRANSYGLAMQDPQRPIIVNFYSSPLGSVALVRAHHLTKEAKYLSGAVLGCHFGLGANPGNHTYTTGVGHDWPRNPLYLDARRTGQAPPHGITTYGQFDWHQFNDDGNTWPIKWVVGATTVPEIWQWPLHEAYFDVPMWPMMSENTTDRFGVNLFVWGYLAARP